MLTGAGRPPIMRHQHRSDVMQQWLFLSVAIVSEVIATSALKASEGFSRLLAVADWWCRLCDFVLLPVADLPHDSGRRRVCDLVRRRRHADRAGRVAVSRSVDGSAGAARHRPDHRRRRGAEPVFQVGVTLTQRAFGCQRCYFFSRFRRRRPASADTPAFPQSRLPARAASACTSAAPAMPSGR